ncbi:MAG: ABC transporter substrate-binding protein [Bacilli bacterium]
MKKSFSLALSLLGLLSLTACGEPSVSTTKPTVPDPTTTITQCVPDKPSGTLAPVAAPTVDSTGSVTSYAARSYDERAKAAGQLEEFGMSNHITGIPLNSNAANVMYNDRLLIPVGKNQYIPNFGFGVGNAKITEPMTDAQESNKAYQEYYHGILSEDPGTINYLDSKDSVTSDLYSLIGLGYYDVRLNNKKDNYEWVNRLATAKPIPLNADGDGLATKWKVPLLIDAKLKYSTLSTDPKITPFNGREVKLADYLTPFKLMLDNQWFRGSDIGSTESGFVGVKKYITDIQKGRKPDWKDVGIQLNEEDNSMTFEFCSAKTPFYAMYNLSSTLYSPISADFINAIGVKNFAKPNINSVLSIGVYNIENWETDLQVVFKKNTTSIVSDEYFFKGYKYKIIKEEALIFKEFIAGKLDSARIPSSQLKEYKTDTRTRKTKGDTVWSLQVNACDEARYNTLFGPNGTINPHKEGEGWKLKPVMSNNDFLEGVYYCIDRKAYAEALGSDPAMAYLSDAYMIDPEKGISYRSSEAGMAVTTKRGGLEGMGHDASRAETKFASAMATLVAAGKYTPGTAAAPTEIKLQMNFQDNDQIKTSGALLKTYIEGAFNKACPLFKLTIEPVATENWMDAYYVAMYGEFDFTWGAISGNTLNPLDFFNVLSDTNVTGFTLSWGAETGEVSDKILYDGNKWSFDGLYSAFTTGSYLVDGKAAPVVSSGAPTVVDLKCNNFEFSVNVNTIIGNTSATVVIDSLVFYDLVAGEQVRELDMETALTGSNGKFKISGTYSHAKGQHAMALQVFYAMTLNGVTSIQELDVMF